VVLTPDGWLAFVGHGTNCVYCKQVPAMEELVRALKDEVARSSVVRPHKPLPVRER